MNQTLDDQRLSLFLDRYALKDENGKPVESTPEEMWTRVANAIACCPSEADEFRTLLSDFKFVPGGRILAGAGAETEKTFYNCYVIPVETSARRHNRNVVRADVLGRRYDAGADSREAIFDTIKTMVDIMSRGGGVGINWSVLRPSGSYLTRVSGTSSGPVGWMNVASEAVGEVEQGGSRRGAAMFMLNDWHPDVLRFIEAKREKGKITNANISVAVSDKFMETLKAKGTWTFRFPDTTDPRYNTDWDGDIEQWERNGGGVKTYGEVPADDVWTAIAESAHASGEPGVVFLDRYNALSTANGAERIISVNPCGEQGLGAYSVCNLGAMNLDAYVVSSEKGTFFDWRRFTNDTRSAIRFLDRVIDKNFYFLQETADAQSRLRRIGLGVMGLADALVRLGIRYGSPEAIDFTEQVFFAMKANAILASVALADELGPAAAWKPEMWDRPYLKEFAEKFPSLRKKSLRNLFLLTQAPTGTTALLAGVNSGIEPFFALRTWREDRTGGRWVVPQSLRDWVSEFEFTEAKVSDAPDYVVTSADVTVTEHVKMQGAVQKNVDSSVSKTINAPKGQSVSETKHAFTLAWDEGCKGIAYYRDGSRSVQVLYHDNPNEKIAELEDKVAALEAKLAFKERTDTYIGSAGKSQEFVGFTLNYTGGHSVNCSGSIVFEEGCQRCYTCSWTAC